MALPDVVLSALSISRRNRKRTVPGPFAAFLMLALCAFAAAAQAQNADRIAQGFDPTPTAVLANHHPLWASPANDLGPLDPNQTIDNLTLVLARSPEQQSAFDQLVEDQQDPNSPEYHHWLTAPEIGRQFGLTDHDIAAITSWLTGQGLHVRFVTPDKVLIAFGGSAANVGRAFGTEMHAYKVHGEERISVASDPRIPWALAPVIQAVRGLFTIRDRPQNHTHAEFSDRPDMTILNDGVYYYFITPADFATIYDVPSTYTGKGVTIGIVSESHTDFGDFEALNNFLGTSLNNPTEIVPTAAPFDAVDPGPAYDSEPSCAAANPPTCSSAVTEQLDVQSEATLDVTRAGTIAPGATVDLIIAEDEQSGPSEGIWTDAEYLAETTPAPAQIMSISFGACESEAGPSGVADWSTLFETAAAAGYSIFISSGDSGAAGCDTSFAAPPTSPAAISPNYICSPPYETCMGGTEFNDASDYSTYWNTMNGAGYESAKSYIPEGAWNEPGDASSGFQVAGTGGGVSSFVATPTWQTGTGVPSAKAGRYTPDISFSASEHDGYFGCLVSGGGDCANGYFVEWAGTSAAAPDMAGIAALVDQKTGSAQGNITPKIYSLAGSDPAAFHDVTVATSGVTSCSVDTPSMCNNSIPGPTSLTTGAEAGYKVQTGYDEATGWGSLDVNLFLQDFTSTTTGSFTISASPASVTVAQGGTGTSTITIAPTGGFTGAVEFTTSGLPSGVTSSFATGTAADTEVLTLTATDSAAVTASPVTITITGTSGSLTENATVSLTITTITTGSFTLSASPTSVSVAQGGTGTSTITIAAAGGFTGAVAFTASGLPSGVSSSFAAGTEPDTEVLTLTATTSATTGSSTVTVTGTSGSLIETTKVALTVTNEPSFEASPGTGSATLSVTPGQTTGNTETISVVGTYGFSGTVALSCALTASPNGASDLPTCSLSPGSVTLSGATAQTSVLTVTTTANSSAENRIKKIFWPTTGGTALALVLFFITPRRRRNWLAMAGLLVLFAAAGLTACGGGNSGGGGGGGGNSGTTTGNYTIAVTGASGAQSNVPISTITLIVE
ncbi:MAG TPA: protease pro-enzyme activation domain-containing protein [Terracidiphilus sp.]|nr:protease pro-enzyme activation domain-containing protein [Terracidiphilus sp.]